MPINLFSIDVSLSLKSRKKLKSFLQGICLDYDLELKRLNVIFCSDRYLLDLNKQFLDHDTLTDILTFPISKSHEPIEAEIYISLDRVAANALTFKESPARELHRVIFHGVLHLCGFGDKTASEKKKMRNLENFYLQSYFSQSVSRGTGSEFHVKR